VAAGGTIPVVQRVFRHIWREGRGAETPAELADLAAELGVADVVAALADPVVKASLKSATDVAIDAGVFGVPMLIVHGERFFGQDATPFALAALDHPTLLKEGEYARARLLPVGVSRR
jgi:2-hydroxychromene-2-carboxylate isomerase